MIYVIYIQHTASQEGKWTENQVQSTTDTNRETSGNKHTVGYADNRTGRYTNRLINEERQTSKKEDEQRKRDRKGGRERSSIFSVGGCNPTIFSGSPF